MKVAHTDDGRESAFGAFDLSWDNLCYSIGGNKILSNLSGRAVAGRSLAVMGPSGAGKTTFLNAVAARLGTGRMRSDQRHHPIYFWLNYAE